MAVLIEGRQRLSSGGALRVLTDRPELATCLGRTTVAGVRDDVGGQGARGVGIATARAFANALVCCSAASFS